jgi:murein L,D-transpeptidase YafK
MTDNVLNRLFRLAFAPLALATMALLGLSACSQIDVPAHLRPISKETMMLLGKKGVDVAAPIHIRIFKEESELELWKQRPDGRFHHIKTYPICNWSGDLGPKLSQGDKQAPEGFYQVSRTAMNPNSQFHLSFNLGFPNAYDRSHKRTGDFLMVHGKCKSAGCYAMTDALIEEIYAFARESFIGGQEFIHVHAFPFRMTDANMARHAKHKWIGFWQTLKEGHDHFETTRTVPQVAVCARNYVVNVKLPANVSRVDPEGVCPRFERPVIDAFKPNPNEKHAETRIVVPGVKERSLTAQSAPSTTWTSVRSALGGLLQDGQ